MWPASGGVLAGEHLRTDKDHLATNSLSIEQKVKNRVAAISKPRTRKRHDCAVIRAQLDDSKLLDCVQVGKHFLAFGVVHLFRSFIQYNGIKDADLCKVNSYIVEARTKGRRLFRNC